MLRRQAVCVCVWREVCLIYLAASPTTVPSLYPYPNITVVHAGYIVLEQIVNLLFSYVCTNFHVNMLCPTVYLPAATKTFYVYDCACSVKIHLSWR